LRYVANGSEFSGNGRSGLGPMNSSRTTLLYAGHYNEFEGASPQKSPQW
jgi:hypothetical protein